MNTRKRFFKVVFVFTKIFLSFRKEFNLVKKKGFKKAQTIMAKVHEKRANDLFELATHLGGVLIKLCQYFSTRRDIFPEAYIRILSPLQDSVPPLDFTEINKVLIQEYGDHRHYFDHVDETPIASASLGQTHKAKLKKGPEVILKILKPEVEKIIDIDFAIIYFVFKLFSNFEFFKKQGDFFTLLEEFIRVTGDELNFKREAAIAMRFKNYFSKYSFLKIPHVYTEYSTDKIIVMEFLDGDKIADEEKWIKRNNDPILISKRLIRIYIDQFLYFKTIHFDPHPGNIFIEDNSEICLIDYGMSGEITDKMRNGIKDSLKAFITRDYYKVIDIMEDLGFIRKGANKYLLIPVMEYFFDEAIETVSLERESMQSVDFEPVIDDLVEIMYSQPFNLPVEWAFIGRTIGTLVGIISMLNPNINIFHELKPYTDELLKSNAGEIVSTVKDYIIEQSKLLSVLPKKMNSILDKVERGQLKFKVDFTEVDEKLDDFREMFLKASSIGISVLTGLAAYIVYVMDKPTQSIILASIASAALMFGIVYKKRSIREEIKKNIRTR